LIGANHQRDGRAFAGDDSSRGAISMSPRLGHPD
jgi:hypothetical protein